MEDNLWIFNVQLYFAFIGNYPLRLLQRYIGLSYVPLSSFLKNIFWSTWVDPANTGAPCTQRDRATSLENQADGQLSQLRKKRSKENEYIFNMIIMQVALSTGEGFRVIEKLIAMPVVRSRGRRSLWAEGQQGHQARGWQEEGRRRRRAPATSPDRRTPPWENVGTLVDISPHPPTLSNCCQLFLAILTPPPTLGQNR